MREAVWKFREIFSFNLALNCNCRFNKTITNNAILKGTEIYHDEWAKFVLYGLLNYRSYNTALVNGGECVTLKFKFKLKFGR